MRPTAPIINKTLMDDQVTKCVITQATGLFTVCYMGEPFNLRQETGFAQPKYLRTAFAHPGSAHLLARKLNALFKTDLFDVRLATVSDVALPDPRLF